MAHTAGMGEIFYPELVAPTRSIGKRSFDFSRQVVVIAVVETFSTSSEIPPERGPATNELEACERAIAAKAEWIEIRGIPFGAGPDVSGNDELARLVPVIQACRQRTDAVISVDTFRTDVAAAVLKAGADVISDSSGLRNPELARITADHGGGLIIGHSLGAPTVPLYRPSREDIAWEVTQTLAQRVATALTLGLPQEKIFIDPGRDLNKNSYHSLQLTGRLAEVTSTGYPTVVSASRKPFLQEAAGQVRRDGDKALIATLVASVLQGARLVRVHDLSPAVAAVQTTEAILGWRKPAAPRHNLA